MVKYINLNRIIEHLNYTFGKYSNKDLKNTLTKLLQNYSYEESILK